MPFGYGAACALAASVAMSIAAGTIPARAETPAAYCARAGTDDLPRPIPEALAPAVNAAFGTRMPARVAVDTTVFRCDRGHVWVCTAGANLPCGKANTDRAPGAGVVRWCRDHADDATVPAVAAGHDAIHAWRCQVGSPRMVGRTLDVDHRGFIARFWKVLP